MKMKDNELSAAVDAIRHGGIIAYPTESVYGLGCDPFDLAAVTRLLAIKKRRQEQGVILIASHFEQIEALIGPIDTSILSKVRASWPGPINWLLPASKNVPSWIKGQHDSVALRISAHPIAHRLCELAGQPLVSTSANRHGEPSLTTAIDVSRSFADDIDAIIDAPLGGALKACTIIDAITDAVVRG